jgi:Ulp1 family protease
VIIWANRDKNTHWAVLIILPYETKGGKVLYLDSLGKCGKDFLEGIKRWMMDNMNNKGKLDFDISLWSFIDCGKTVPQQLNGNDYAVFSLVNVQHFIEELPLVYTQNDIYQSLFRRKILSAFLNESLGY